MEKEDYFLQGMDFFIEDRYEEAIKAYQNALEIDPNYCDALLALGESYAKLNRLDEAIEAAKRAIAVDPDEIMAQTSLSRFYQQKGMIAEAETAGAQARILSWKEALQKKG